MWKRLRYDLIKRLLKNIETQKKVVHRNFDVLKKTGFVCIKMLNKMINNIFIVIPRNFIFT